MKRCTFLLAALVIVGGLSSAQAQLHWDRSDGVVGGNPGGPTFADGNWDLVTANWNTNSDGSGANILWTDGNPAVFSAGTDVSGDPVVDAVVTLVGTLTPSSMLVEEGKVFFIGSGAASIAGDLTINAGAQLSVNSAGRVAGAGKIILNGGTWEHEATNTVAVSNIPAGKTLEINGSGTVIATALGTSKVTIYGSATLTTAVITGTGGTTGNGGAGTLIKSGPDEFRYQGLGLPNTTYAKLVVNEGLFRLGFSVVDVEERGFGAVPLAPLADAITLNGGNIAHSFSATTLHVNRGITIGVNGGAWAGGTVTVPGQISGSGTFGVTGGQMTINNASNATSFTGKWNIASGTLVSNSDAALGTAPGSFAADQITLGRTTPTVGTGTLSASASYTLDANRGITVNNIGRINIASGGNTLTYNGAITGPGKFIKMGDGTLVSSGSHNHAGGTDIYGRLTVNGSLAGAGAVAVKTTAAGLGTNGTLAGTGTVAGAVTVESAGRIAPGSGGIESLTLQGGLTLNAGSILDFELGAPTTSDLIDVTLADGFNIAGSSTVNLVNAGGLGAGNYTLIDYAGTLGGSFSNLVLGTTDPAFSYMLVNTGSTIDVSVSLIAPANDADFNQDGTIDAADYVVWRKFNPQATGATQGTGDADGDMDNDATDYAEWVENFGEPSPGSGGGGAVPEPSTIAMLVIGLAAFAGRRRS